MSPKLAQSASLRHSQAAGSFALKTFLGAGFPKLVKSLVISLETIPTFGGSLRELTWKPSFHFFSPTSPLRISEPRHACQGFCLSGGLRCTGGLGLLLGLKLGFPEFFGALLRVAQGDGGHAALPVPRSAQHFHEPLAKRNTWICMFAYIHIYIYILYIEIYAYVCIHIHIDIYLYVCFEACRHTCSFNSSFLFPSPRPLSLSILRLPTFFPSPRSQRAYICLYIYICYPPPLKYSGFGPELRPLFARLGVTNSLRL